MEKPTLLIAVGTRPEVIKMAPLYFACKEREAFSTLLCASGQHFELLDSALLSFGLTPDVRFASESGSLAETTAHLLRRFSEAIDTLSPDGVAVHGDTLTAFCAALAAFYKGVPVFHVEAGLRTGDLRSPFPEELYRVVIDRLAEHCFAPTETARARLFEEGKDEEAVTLCGNTAIDALRYTVKESFSHPLLRLTEEKKLVLFTCHRRESHARLASLFSEIRRAVEERDDVLMLFPVHPSPPVRRAAEGVFDKCKSVMLLPPLDITLFHNLLSRADLLLTDSGGVEEEATALGVPTLVMRDKTERPEGVEAGVLFPVGTDGPAVREALTAALTDPPVVCPSAVYGDGHAGERIALRIEALLLEKKRGVLSAKKG